MCILPEKFKAKTNANDTYNFNVLIVLFLVS